MKSASKRTKTSAKSLQNVPAVPSSGTTGGGDGFPPGVFRHSRYLSAWGEQKIRVAMGHFKTPDAKIRIFDFDEITLQTEGHGIYTGTLNLTDFPHFTDALKVALNRALRLYDSGKLENEIPRALGKCCAIFSLLLQSGFYSLRDCPRDHLNKITDAVATKSTLGALNLDAWLEKIEAELTVEIATKFIGTSNAKAVGINHVALSKAVGFYIPATHIPNSFRKALTAICEREAVPIRYEKPKPSASDLKAFLLAANLLSVQPEGIDSFSYQAYPEVNSVVKHYFPDDGEQTRNIKPAQFFALATTLLTWVFDYAPHVIALVADFRRSAQDFLDGKLTVRSLKKRMAGLYDKLIMEKSLVAEPFNSINGQDPGSIQFVVRMTMIACGCLVAANHARRANEIFGYNVPYGLYFGCLEQPQEGLLEFLLDAYIQKGEQDYRKFPANSLVASAISVLEELYNLTRLLGEPEMEKSNVQSNNRGHKLFVSRLLSPNSFAEDERHEVWYRPYFNELLKDSGIDPADWHESQTPFRRYFITLHVRRYDLPEIPAVQRQAGHFDINSTTSYYSDTGNRPVGESVAELHGRAALTLDSIAMLEALEEGNREYLEECVGNLLNGAFTGGVFARVILALVKRLSRDSNFTKLTVERKASVVTQKLLKRGYRAEPMPHTICAAGNARHTRKAANCFEDGALHREKATPGTCSGCVHSWSNANYQRNVRAELDRCLAQAAQPDLAENMRNEYLAVADELGLVLETEIALQSDTLRLLEEISASWNEDVLREVKA